MRSKGAELADSSGDFRYVCVLVPNKPRLILPVHIAFRCLFELNVLNI